MLKTNPLVLWSTCWTANGNKPKNQGPASTVKIVLTQGNRQLSKDINPTGYSKEIKVQFKTTMDITHKICKKDKNLRHLCQLLRVRNIARTTLIHISWNSMDKAWRILSCHVKKDPQKNLTSKNLTSKDSTQSCHNSLKASLLTRVPQNKTNQSIKMSRDFQEKSNTQSPSTQLSHRINLNPKWSLKAR